MNKISILVVFIFCFTSCKTISIQKEAHTKTEHNITLGVVGEDKQFVLKQDYNHTAIPEYENGIKVQVSNMDFNKTSFKAFTQSKMYQSKNVSVNYIDTISNKPKYLKLEIADRVGVLNALNSKENTDVFQFLENKKAAHLVTSITMALNESDLAEIENADEVYLEMVGKKSYSLKTYKNEKEQSSILFNQGIVFAYQTSNFCWKQNDKYQLEIVDLVEGNDKCPNRTYKSSKRAIKKIDYYDF